MANLDEDYYQKTGTENDAPDPMVPDKEDELGIDYLAMYEASQRTIVYLGEQVESMRQGEKNAIENIKDLKGQVWVLKQVIKEMEQPAQVAPGPTITPGPDTKRRDDHAAYVASVRKAVATDVIGFAAGYLTDEEWDSVDASVEDYLMSQDAAYRAVWDHATKHALEDAEADGVVMGMPAPRR